MASTDKLIRITLKLNNQLSKGLGQASSSLEKMGKSMTRVGGTMTTGLTLPIVAAGAAIFKTFADFENVMAELQARTGATTSEMEKIKQVALEMGRDTVFSATEAAEAMLELTASGSSAAEAIAQLPAVLNLAAAGAIDLGRAADGVTDIMKGFQLEVRDSASIADMLARAAGSSSATVEDLLQGFSNVGPAANAMGLSVGETAAALAVFSENGIKSAKAGTTLRSMLTNMTRDTERVQNTWNELGISMFDAAGMARPLDDVFKDITAAMDGMSMEDQNRIAQNLAGTYGKLGFLSLTASDGISDMQNSMSGAASASEVAQARMDTLGGKVISMKGSFETLAIVLGDLGDGPLKSFITFITEAVNSVTTWAQENPKLAQTLMLVVGAIALLGPVLMVFGAIASAIASISAVIGVLTGGVTALAAAFAVLTAPVLLFIVVAGVLIGVLILLARNWDAVLGAISNAGIQFLAWFQSWGPELADLWNMIAVFISQGMLKAITAATQLFQTLQIIVLQGLQNAAIAATQFGQILAVSILGGLMQAVTAAQQLIASLALVIMTGFNNFLLQWQQNLARFGEITQLGFGKAKGAMGNLITTWQNNFKMLSSIVSKGASLVIKTIQGLTAQIATILQALPAVMKTIAVNIMSGLINGIKSKISEFINTMKGMVDGTVNMVKNAFDIRSPSKVMAKMGAQVVQGFNAGVADTGGIGVDVPSLSAGATAGGASGAAMASGGGAGVIINIETITVPSGTTQEQVDAIVLEIGKRIKKHGGSNIR